MNPRWTEVRPNMVMRRVALYTCAAAIVLSAHYAMHREMMRVAYDEYVRYADKYEPGWEEMEDELGVRYDELMKTLGRRPSSIRHTYPDMPLLIFKPPRSPES